jgi:hypothetical protein
MKSEARIDFGGNEDLRGIFAGVDLGRQIRVTVTMRVKRRDEDGVVCALEEIEELDGEEIAVLPPEPDEEGRAVPTAEEPYGLLIYSSNRGQPEE